LDDYYDEPDLVQNIPPTLSEAERESLIYGITPVEWSKFWSLGGQ